MVAFATMENNPLPRLDSDGSIVGHAHGCPGRAGGEHVWPDGTPVATPNEGGSVPAERVGLDALVQAYADARSFREEISDREKYLRGVEVTAERALFEALERLNLRSVRHATLGLFTMNDMANADVTDEAKLREWALEEMPDLMLPNRMRLGKVVRDTLKEGGDLPPGVDVVFYRKISWRRGT